MGRLWQGVRKRQPAMAGLRERRARRLAIVQRARLLAAVPAHAVGRRRLVHSRLPGRTFVLAQYHRVGRPDAGRMAGHAGLLPAVQRLDGARAGRQRRRLPAFHVHGRACRHEHTAVAGHGGNGGLGWKASNLTHRGIVSGGPYRYIRHPAYTAKNIAWWIASVPAFTLAWQASAMQGLQVAGATLAWSGLYVLRALTEEDHLRSVDEHYSKYCEAVRFRFLPGLI
ncbi:MAG: DUF1295 domain-containing protein [Proteobacteria bacterium]|nr:DUF1295 domain-containing protein [Pseudomonadota bacterium]